MASFTVVKCPASKYFDIIDGMNITFYKDLFNYMMMMMMMMMMVVVSFDTPSINVYTAEDLDNAFLMVSFLRNTSDLIRKVCLFRIKNEEHTLSF